MTDIQKAIFNEMHRALANCGATLDLLCITGSFGDTLDDKTILEMLTQWNKDTELTEEITDAMDAVEAKGTVWIPGKESLPSNHEDNRTSQ